MLLACHVAIADERARFALPEVALGRAASAGGLVRLPRLSAQIKPHGEVVAKLEFFNPLSSVKDRIGVAMIEALEAKGQLKPGATSFKAGKLGTFEIKGDNILLGKPFIFNKGNIDEFDF